MSTEEIDRRLAELGDVAQRLPLPPLPEIHRRAARRHRARIARRTAGVAAAAVVASVIAFGGGHLAADKGVTPATRTPGATTCVETAVPPAELDDELRLLPDHIPAGTAFWQVESATVSSGCGGPSAGAWLPNAEGTELVGAVTFTPTPAEALQTDGAETDPCRLISAARADGTCVRARITGEQRLSWRAPGTPGGGTVITWAQDDFVWRAAAVGLSSTQLDAALAGLRISGESVVSGTLPRGMETWRAPNHSTKTHRFTAFYRPPPASEGDTSQQDPAGDVTVVVTDDPWQDARADPMKVSGGNESPVLRPTRPVAVGDGKAFWWQDVNGSGTLTWQAGGGVTVSIGGNRLTLAEAQRVADSMRRAGIDDERLTCDPDKNPWGSCGG